MSVCGERECLERHKSSETETKRKKEGDLRVRDDKRGTIEEREDGIKVERMY